ncbi:Ankyrin repeat family protein [Abeliophyllum distichum]|uniref:Ankyrin repeat family protein n=1 Tax=Abeliophyllum distichum TaxID=126358 RepID=A0ABD1T280_9LAMI
MDPSLYRAAQEANLDALREKKELFSTQLTPNKNTPLHVVALFNDSPECIAEILRTNVSLLYEVNLDGDTALHIAARNGMFDVGIMMFTWANRIDEELETGGGALKKLLTWRNKNGDTALHEAIRNDNQKMVIVLLKRDPEIANIVNNALETPLFVAIDERRVFSVEFILELCPSPAYIGPEGRTALHAAALYDWKNQVKVLARVPDERGGFEDVKPNAKPLLGVAQGAKSRLGAWEGYVGFLIVRMDDSENVYCEKHPTLTKEVDDFGWTALHYAARYGAVKVTRELLNADKFLAYIAAEKDSNKTALHLATCEGYVKIMEEILTHCPDCWEMVTSDGQNILHLAVKFEKQEAFEFILSKSWVRNLVNQKDAEGNTCLHLYAATHNFKGRNLVNHPQANASAWNKKHMTPLDVLTYSEVYSQRQVRFFKFFGVLLDFLQA